MQKDFFNQELYSDAGSALGRFYYGISEKHADLLTRGTIYLGLVVVHTVPLFLL